jgi:hypothetical protein
MSPTVEARVRNGVEPGVEMAVYESTTNGWEKT